jgi:hypothetical protein
MSLVSYDLKPSHDQTRIWIISSRIVLDSDCIIACPKPKLMPMALPDVFVKYFFA